MAFPPSIDIEPAIAALVADRPIDGVHVDNHTVTHNHVAVLENAPSPLDAIARARLILLEAQRHPDIRFTRCNLVTHADSIKALYCTTHDATWCVRDAVTLIRRRTVVTPPPSTSNKSWLGRLFSAG